MSLANESILHKVREGLTTAQHWFLEGILYQIRCQEDHAQMMWEDAQKNYHMLMDPYEGKEYDRAKRKYEQTQGSAKRTEFYWIETFKYQNAEREANTLKKSGEEKKQ